MNKLIRDLIPARMTAEGRCPRLSILSGAALVAALQDKLQEECGEVLQAQTAMQRLEEMADVFEVLRALAACDGHDIADLIAAADDKRQRNGGFDGGIFYSGDEIE